MHSHSSAETMNSNFRALWKNLYVSLINLSSLFTQPKVVCPFKTDSSSDNNACNKSRQLKYF